MTTKKLLKPLIRNAEMTKTYERLWMDFETFSRVNLKTDGGKKYAEDDSTMPICLGFALDDVLS
jgi:hypothetical protein